MILAQIKQYLMQHKRSTLNDLALHFDTEPEAMQGMLKQWISKGKIKVIQSTDKTACCNSCASCNNAKSMEIYEWQP